MTVTAPQGFEAAGVAAGLKSTGKPDVAVVVNRGPLKAGAAVFTSNRAKANPIIWSQQAIADGRNQYPPGPGVPELLDAVAAHQGLDRRGVGKEDGTHTYRNKVAIMVGAEGPGLTEHAMRAADVRAKIPMQPGTDSLNVATAAAIGFYAASEALRTSNNSNEGH